MFRTQAYDVEVKPTCVDITAECKHVHAEDGKIAVGSKVHVTDTVDTKDATETTPDGKIKPYGLELTNKGDVETSVKAEPDVIQEHVEKAIKKNTKKSK